MYCVGTVNLKACPLPESGKEKCARREVARQRDTANGGRDSVNGLRGAANEMSPEYGYAFSEVKKEKCTLP